MLEHIDVLVCPWCGADFPRDQSADTEPRIETSRSAMMAVFRLLASVPAACPKCKATCTIDVNVTQMWNVPPGESNA